MEVFKQKTQFCMLLRPVFSYRKRGGLKFTDEPTGNLDSETSGEVLEFLQKTSRCYDQTIVMITHDPHIAAKADRMIKIGDGKIIA